MQTEINRSEELHAGRLQRLEDNRRKFESLEEQAAAIREKEALEKKIRLLKQKRDWALFDEQKKIVKV